MADTIKESGMDFVTDNTFHIEKSPQYALINDNIKSVEFVRVKDNKLLFVEAKTTFANPQNPVSGNRQKFENEIAEICEKFIHSLNLYSSIDVGITADKFPTGYTPADKVVLVFVLVVKNHKLEWCAPIKTGLLEKLPLYIKKIWKPAVVVMNSEKAVEEHIIVNQWQLFSSIFSLPERQDFNPLPLLFKIPPFRRRIFYRGTTAGQRLAVMKIKPYGLFGVSDQSRK
jgi:hypothetical protein